MGAEPPTSAPDPDGFGGQLPTLMGDGLCLRRLEETDAPGLLELFGNAEVVRFTSLAKLTDLADARRLLGEIGRDSGSGTLYQWGIELDGAIAGTCSLAHIDRRHRRAEIGFAVVQRLWGRGIASRAVPPVLEAAFGRLGLHRIEADVDPRNEASLRLLARLGFRREGLLRQRYHQAGEIQDAVLLGLLGPEWSAVRDAVRTGRRAAPARRSGRGPRR